MSTENTESTTDICFPTLHETDLYNYYKYLFYNYMFVCKLQYRNIYFNMTVPMQFIWMDLLLLPFETKQLSFQCVHVTVARIHM